MNSLQEQTKIIGKYTFAILSQYVSNTGKLFLHKTFIEKRNGGGWGIPVEVVYWLDTEILWFKKEVHIGEYEQFNMKVPIDMLETVIDMYVNANTIEK